MRQTYAGVLEIEPDSVAEHRSQVHVLDVRQPEEMHEALGRIAGSQLVPLDELKARLTEIPRDRPVVPVCHAGMRSAQATAILRGAGFERVGEPRRHAAVGAARAADTAVRATQPWCAAPAHRRQTRSTSVSVRCRSASEDDCNGAFAASNCAPKSRSAANGTTAS